ncbi:hypothetical protein CCUS01_04480 [Colletotrichum cuscutae]|uniref:Uncharacterized protein n=1 Tax=Colletotrichum cuscutae TaxID=1209917 RepID=A0AAI9VBQ6_9PEZI|nr:hypothetical protein CCUS01_04480 [Colletotrichum cuscutae]
MPHSTRRSFGQDSTGQILLLIRADEDSVHPHHISHHPLQPAQTPSQFAGQSNNHVDEPASNDAPRQVCPSQARRLRPARRRSHRGHHGHVEVREATQGVPTLRNPARRRHERRGQPGRYGCQDPAHRRRPGHNGHDGRAGGAQSQGDKPAPQTAPTGPPERR